MLEYRRLFATCQAPAAGERRRSAVSKETIITPRRAILRQGPLTALCLAPTAIAAATGVTVEARVDADWVLHATAEIVYLNETDAPLERLVLALPANADADPARRRLIDELELYAANERGRYSFAAPAVIEALSVEGCAVSGWTLEGVRLELPLGEPLLPGQYLSLSVVWRQAVPEFHHRRGRAGEVCLLADWCPRPVPPDYEPGPPWAPTPTPRVRYDVELVPPPGWSVVGGPPSDEERRDAEVVLLPEERLDDVETEVWAGGGVYLIDLTGRAAADHAWVAAIHDYLDDLLGPGEPPRIVLSCELPVAGDEAWERIVVVGDGNRPWLWRYNHLVLAEQTARRRLRRYLDDPVLIDGLARWAARRAVDELLGPRTNLLPYRWPAEQFGVYQERWTADVLYGYGLYGRETAEPLESPTPELYSAAAAERTARALLDWEERHGAESLPRALVRWLYDGAGDTAELIAQAAKESSPAAAAELRAALDGESPRDPAGGFRFRLLPELFPPDSWTLSLSPFGWLDEDDSLSLGCALWGRRGVSLLPMQLWGSHDLLTVINYNLEHDDYNFLLQYTTPLAAAPLRPRLGLGFYARRDEVGGSAQLELQWGPRPPRAPVSELTLGLNYAWLRPFASYYPNGLCGDDGRQLSAYARYYLNGRGPVGGPQFLAQLEYARDPLPELSPAQPPFDYWRLLLVNQLEYRLSGWLWSRLRCSVGQIFGNAPAQRQFELTEDNVEPQYHLLRLPQALEMRGYNDLDVYGDGAVCLSAELDFPVALGFEAGLFFDYGDGGTALDELLDDFDNWRASCGPLLRWRIAGASLEAHFPLWLNRPYDETERLEDPELPNWDLRIDLDASLSF